MPPTTTNGASAAARAGTTIRCCPTSSKAEDKERGADEFHGVGGPLQGVRPSLAADARPRRCTRPRRRPASRPIPTSTARTQEGVGYYQTTINSARRWSSAAGLSAPARKQRKNLTIATAAHATRVLIENGRAVGVEYRTPRRPARRRAPTREVIVSGGVYGSPQLLMLSGLGPARASAAARHRGDQGHAGRRQQPARPLQHLRRLALRAAGHDERPGEQPAAPHPGGVQYALRPHRAAGQHGPLRRRAGAQRQAAGAAGPADQHVRLGDQGAEPRTASCRSPSRPSASARCICGPTAAARCG